MDIHDIAMAANIAAKGGGTSDYTDLDNKPSINGEELSGNMTAAQLGLVGLDSGGKVPINQLPPAAVERMTVVENDTARFALTTDRVQNGDTVKVTATNKMYMVVDDTNLGTEAGYSVYVAGRAAEAVADEDGNNIKESLASKVDKVTGKSLSTNDYTTADKEKLNGIEAQANKTVVDNALSRSSENPVQNKVINAALATKADASVRADIKALEASRYTKTETDLLLNGKQDTLTTTQLAAVNSGITPEKVANYDDCYAVINYNALNHNGIYRGKDLTNVYTIEQIYSMVHSGNFDELFLGDYINISITTTLPDETVKTETVSLMIAAFDYYHNCGDAALRTHHIVLIPRGYGFATTAKMNETNTTTGGYLNSYMHQTVLPCYAKSLKTALNNHLLSHRTILSNTINASTPSMAGAGMTGATSGWEWTTVELQLMNEVQVYGTTVWSSSAYDVGVDNRQLPVFKFITPIHDDNGRGTFWLRSVVSSSDFTGCSGLGGAHLFGASNANYVRPLILFG